MCQPVDMRKFFIFFLTMVLLFPIVKAVPEIPHQFYGSVTYLGNTIPDGHQLTAKLGEEKFTVGIIDGKYGIKTPLLVSKDGSNNINEIDFYVDNKKIITQAYTSGGFTQLDLIIPSNVVIIKESGIEGLNLKIGNEDDLSEEFTGTQIVEFKEGDKSLVKFDYDFNSHSVNELLQNMVIKKQEKTAINGAIIVKGVELPSGKTKTIYVDDLNQATNMICIKDAEISSISEISSQCNAADETLLTCSNTGGTEDGYKCTDLGDYYKVEGLKHSGIVEKEPFCGDGTCGSGESCSSCSTDCGACDNSDDDNEGRGSGRGTTSRIEDETSSEICEPDWECHEWLACVNGMQTRICYDANKCGSNNGKPEEGRECTVSEGAKEDVQTTASAENKEKNSETNSVTGAAFALGEGNVKGFAITTLILAMFVAGLTVTYFVKNYRKRPPRFEDQEASNPGFYQF